MRARTQRGLRFAALRRIHERSADVRVPVVILLSVDDRRCRRRSTRARPRPPGPPVVRASGAGAQPPSPFRAPRPSRMRGRPGRCAAPVPAPRHSPRRTSRQLPVRSRRTRRAGRRWRRARRHADLAPQARRNGPGAGRPRAAARTYAERSPVAAPLPCRPRTRSATQRRHRAPASQRPHSRGGERACCAPGRSTRTSSRRRRAAGGECCLRLVGGRPHRLAGTASCASKR